MNQTLKEKEQELTELRKQTTIEHKKTSFDAAKAALTNDSYKLITSVISDFFAHRITEVDVCSNDSYSFTMNNRFQGGGHDKGTMATVTLKDGVKIDWSYNQRESCYLWVYNHNETNKQQLTGALDYSGKLLLDEFDTNYTHETLDLLLGNDLSDKVLPHIHLFQGLFLGALESFLALYIANLRDCPVKDCQPPPSSDLRRLWGKTFTGY